MDKRISKRELDRELDRSILGILAKRKERDRVIVEEYAETKDSGFQFKHLFFFICVLAGGIIATIAEFNMFNLPAVLVFIGSLLLWAGKKGGAI